MHLQVTIPENVVKRTSSSVSAFQISPHCVWLLFFGGLSAYLTDKDERHQPVMAKTELVELSKAWAELYESLEQHFAFIFMFTFPPDLYAGVTTDNR